MFLLLLVQFHVWSVPGWRYIRIYKISGHIYIYIHTSNSYKIVCRLMVLFTSLRLTTTFLPCFDHGLVISYLLSILFTPSFQQTCFVVNQASRLNNLQVSPKKGTHFSRAAKHPPVFLVHSTILTAELAAKTPMLHRKHWQDGWTFLS